MSKRFVFELKQIKETANKVVYTYKLKVRLVRI